MDHRDDGPPGPGEQREAAGERERPGGASGRSSAPATGGLRIAAVEAAVAAGLAPASGRRLDLPPGEHDAGASTGQPGVIELPDWSDPPTGQVPRILLGGAEGDGSPAMRGPTWREDRADWDDHVDLSFLVEEGTPEGIAGHVSDDASDDDPFDFSFEELGARAPKRVAPEARRDPAPEARRDPAPEARRDPAPEARRDPAPEARRDPAPEARRDPAPAGDPEDDLDEAWATLLAGDEVPQLEGSKLEGLRGRGARHRRRRDREGVPGRRTVAARTGEPAAGSAGEAAGARRTASGDAPGAAPFADEPEPNWLRRDRSPRRRRGTPAPTTPDPVAAGGAASPGAASPGEAAPPPAKRRSPVLATATGLVAGGVALACFFAGAPATLVLVAVLVTLASGEAFGALRRGGLRPATPLGLVAVPFLVVGTYLHGASALPVVLGCTILAGFLWYLAEGLFAGEGPHHPVADVGATLLVVAWVGLLGSFAGLLLAPSAFPHRHGVALVAAIAMLTVAADVGAYATGATLGRHRLAPRISPGKSWEGFAGGTVLTLVVAALVVARIHPFTTANALLLGLVVVVVAPIGDLAESLVKRDLGVKDMGRLLPAHGGVLDRVDAMLFVLPVAYYVVRLAHVA